MRSLIEKLGVHLPGITSRTVDTSERYQATEAEIARCTSSESTAPLSGQYGDVHDRPRRHCSGSVRVGERLTTNEERASRDSLGRSCRPNL
jgi:hypothetical protein